MPNGHFDDSALIELMSDNLNTPQLLALVDEVFGPLKDGINTADIKTFEKFLHTLDSLLGLNLSDSPELSTTQAQLLQKREAARLAKDWPTADEIRKQLLVHKIDVRDTSNGQAWSHSVTN